MYGVSNDSVESHVSFRDKYNLPFRLLSDPDHKLGEAFGAWGEKTFMGKTSLGTNRMTFVIGGDGTVQHVYPNVKPDEHAVEILHDLGKAKYGTRAAPGPAPAVMLSVGCSLLKYLFC